MGAIGWIVVATIVAAGAWAIRTYNALVALRQRCRQAFSDIDVQLKQRHDLVPNLVEIVKGYAAHERQTLKNVHQSPQCRRLRARSHGSGLRRGAVAGRTAPDLRARRSLSGPQGQSEFPTVAERAFRS